MEPDHPWGGVFVVKMTGHCLPHIDSQFFKCFGLRVDAVTERGSAIAALDGILGDFKDNLMHGFSLARLVAGFNLRPSEQDRPIFQTTFDSRGVFSGVILFPANALHHP